MSLATPVVHVLLAMLTMLLAGRLGAAQPRILYEQASPYNTIVVTEDDQGLRTLFFERGGVRQSVVKVGDPDHLELPYARAMLVAATLVDQPRRMLIVGLGGGTIPSFLHKHYPKTAIDVVDIDPDVVRVARRFFGFREDATLRAHVADGRRYIEACRQPYDVIFLDAFSSENIPYHLATREFLVAVRRALAPGGVAAGNIWSRASNPLHDNMVRTYQDVFDELHILDVRAAGNEILLALPHKRRLIRDELARRARRVSHARRFGFDAGDLVMYGFREPQDTGLNGTVLRDGRQIRESRP